MAAMELDELKKIDDGQTSNLGKRKFETSKMTEEKKNKKFKTEWLKYKLKTWKKLEQGERKSISLWTLIISIKNNLTS